MRNSAKVLWFALVFALGATFALPKAPPVPKDKANTIVIYFKDGHRQTFNLSDISRIEMNGSPLSFSSDRMPDMDRGHFVGKWRVGDGAGGTFVITLSRDGEAEKTLGSGHGTWTVEDGEAVISWDDGWHDVIRRSGKKFRKEAYSPGAPLSGEPSNTAEATPIEPI
jgi:hypothetical protein